VQSITSFYSCCVDNTAKHIYIYIYNIYMCVCVCIMLLYNGDDYECVCVGGINAAIYAMLRVVCVRRGGARL
jgi:membrane associated rhomboid family serine protease